MAKRKAELEVLTAEPPVDRRIASILTELQKSVEAGEISSLAYVAVTREGGVITYRSQLPNKFTMIGGIELLKQEILEP